MASPRPYNQRMCEVCGVLGDEYHLLLVCKSLSDLIPRYIPEYYFKYPSMYKFIALMSTAHVKTIRNLATFVYIQVSNGSHFDYFIFVLSPRTCMHYMNCKMLKYYV